MSERQSDPLALPPPEKLREIAARQDANEREIQQRRGVPAKGPDERAAAAGVIQRNYRGYRSRREQRGYNLSSSARWTDAVREARYQNSTKPRGPADSPQVTAFSGPGSPSAKQSWKRAGAVALRAGQDESSEEEEVDEGQMTAEEREIHRQKKRETKAEREKVAKTMGLEYFLEMVDHKHRYGSSLRAYHRVWQSSGSNENFFYWLDHGEGKDFELEERPRKRLEEEQIRYLSREERKRYMVKIDKQGRLCWVKNGEPICTSPDFKDSVEGIVPANSRTPTWRETVQGVKPVKEDASSSSSENDSDSVSGISVGSHEDASKYVNQDLHEAKGFNKLKHISAGAVMNNLLRKTTKKNTWIFVADTSFRLYIGIKQSGAFQHSSFLHGGRVSSAGLIRIKRGQLRRLDPLSGHYAPPAKNFRGFVHNLEEAGADMSRVSISRSYAVLVGLEGYLGAKKSVKKGEQKLKDMVHPEEKRKREESKRDKSKSAEKEREVLERQAREQEELKRSRSLPYRVMRRFKSETGDVSGESGIAAAPSSAIHSSRSEVQPSGHDIQGRSEPGLA